MSRKPHKIVNEERAVREGHFRAAPHINTFRNIDEVMVDMTFHDPEGKLHPSPRSRRFSADMHAFFDFPCAQHECLGGGFDATNELQAVLRKHRSGSGRHVGKLTCEGTRQRLNGRDRRRCGIEMTYELTIRGKASAA
jgi:hypothetical protein